MTLYNSGVQLPITGAPDMDNLEQTLTDVYNSLHTLAAQLGGTASIAADATLAESDFIVLVDSASAAVTVTLPAIAEVAESKRLFIKAISASNPVTITAASGDLIEGTHTSVLINFPQCVAIVSNATGWWII